MTDQSTTKQQLKLLLKDVSEVFCLSVDQVLERSNTRRICGARHAFCYLAQELFGATSIAIGRFIDRDHTTVLGAISRCSALVEHDTGYFQKVERVARKIELRHRLGTKFEVDDRSKELSAICCPMCHAHDRFQISNDFSVYACGNCGLHLPADEFRRACTSFEQMMATLDPKKLADEEALLCQ